MFQSCLLPPSSGRGVTLMMMMMMHYYSKVWLWCHIESWIGAVVVCEERIWYFSADSVWAYKSGRLVVRMRATSSYTIVTKILVVKYSWLVQFWSLQEGQLSWLGIPQFCPIPNTIEPWNFPLQQFLFNSLLLFLWSQPSVTSSVDSWLLINWWSN